MAFLSSLSTRPARPKSKQAGTFFMLIIQLLISLGNWKWFSSSLSQALRLYEKKPVFVVCLNRSVISPITWLQCNRESLGILFRLYRENFKIYRDIQYSKNKLPTQEPREPTLILVSAFLFEKQVAHAMRATP